MSTSSGQCFVSIKQAEESNILRVLLPCAFGAEKAEERQLSTFHFNFNCHFKLRLGQIDQAEVRLGGQLRRAVEERGGKRAILGAVVESH